MKRLKEGGHSVTDHGDLVSVDVECNDEYYDEYYDECNDECYWAFEQVGPRGGPEEVLEFSKITAERVKAILDQGQVS